MFYLILKKCLSLGLPHDSVVTTGQEQEWKEEATAVYASKPRGTLLATAGVPPFQAKKKLEDSLCWSERRLSLSA